MSNKSKYYSKHENDGDVRNMLNQLGWSQYDLARESGFGISTVNNWATGRSRTPKIIVKYLELLLMIKTIEGAKSGKKA